MSSPVTRFLLAPYQVRIRSLSELWTSPHRTAAVRLIVSQEAVHEHREPSFFVIHDVSYLAFSPERSPRLENADENRDFGAFLRFENGIDDLIAASKSFKAY